MRRSAEDQVSSARAEVAEPLLKFPGRVKEICGRPFLNISDYREWPDRRVIGRLQLIPGVDAKPWNQCIDARGR